MQTENYRVSWKHDTYVPPSSNVGQTRQTTICYLKDAEGNILHEGSVGCFHKDRPNRLVAIKESFKKAVQNVTDKKVRAALWEGFLLNSPKCKEC